MELSVPIPKTPDGKANQRCPDPECRPGLFQLGGAPDERPNQVREQMRRIPGGGDTICPYCGRMGPDREFIDPADVEAVKREVAWAAERDVRDALKDIAGTFNRGVPSGGFISLRMDVKEQNRHGQSFGEKISSAILPVTSAAGTTGSTPSDSSVRIAVGPISQRTSAESSTW
jgi:hypothetical protein